MQNGNMTDEAKKTAIDNVMGGLKNGLAFVSKVNKVDVSGLLNFSGAKPGDNGLGTGLGPGGSTSGSGGSTSGSGGDAGGGSGGSGGDAGGGSGGPRPPIKPRYEQATPTTRGMIGR